MLLSLARCCRVTLDPEAALKHIQRARAVLARAPDLEELRPQLDALDTAVKKQLLLGGSMMGNFWNGGKGANSERFASHAT